MITRTTMAKTGSSTSGSLNETSPKLAAVNGKGARLAETRRPGQRWRCAIIKSLMQPRRVCTHFIDDL